MANVSLTDYSSQAAENARRQRLAELLQQQGAEPEKVFEYNGIQAPISPLSGLAKALQLGMGAYMEGKNAKKATDIEKAKREEAIRFLTKDVKGSELTKFEEPATAGAGFMPVAQPKPQDINTAVPTLQNPSPAPQMQAAPSPQMYQAPQPAQATAAGNVAPKPEDLQKMYLQAALSGNDVLAPIAANQYKTGQATAAALAEDEDFAQKVGDIPGLSDTQRKQIIATRAVNPQAAGVAMGAMLAPEKPEAGPSAVQEYKYAQGQGFKGSYMDFVGAKREAGREPPRQAAPASGKPAAAAPPSIPGVPPGFKPTPFQLKELTNISQASNAVDQGLAALASAPKAFTFGRGLATLGGEMGESLASRKDSPEERAARYAVFNNVSATIKERAGTAQSKSEKETLMKFLPNQYDSEGVIQSKLSAYKDYLASKRDATLNPMAPLKPKPSAAPTATGAYSDPAKEAAYQAWKKANKK